MITCFTTIDDRIELLPPFVRYYRHIGVDHIIITVRRGPNNPLWRNVLGFLSDFPVSVVHGSDAVFQDGTSDNDHRNQLRTGIPGWHVIADLDEFHNFNGQDVEDVTKEADKAGAVGAYLTIADRITEDGSLPNIRGGGIEELFPMQCNITEVIGANTTKAGLVKSGVPTGGGAHYVNGRMLTNNYECHHFKWDAGVIARTERRLRLWSGLPDGVAFKSEPEALLKRLEKGVLDLEGLHVSTASELEI